MFWNAYPCLFLPLPRRSTFNLLQVGLAFLSAVLSHPMPNHCSFEENPIYIALDNSSTVSDQITSALITLASSFPQPVLNSDGCLITRREAIDGDVQIFGQIEAHREAVHSSLKILFCTSKKAKEAALECESCAWFSC